MFQHRYCRWMFSQLGGAYCARCCISRTRCGARRRKEAARCRCMGELDVVRSFKIAERESTAATTLPPAMSPLAEANPFSAMPN